MPIKNEKDLPEPLQRSDKKAQRTWAKAANSAEEQYGEGERSRRTAWSALKHTHEKKGDRWVRKDEKGPSDPQAKQGTPKSRSRPKETFGGVDVESNSKQELYDRAKRLGVEGRSNMDKKELARAIARKQ